MYLRMLCLTLGVGLGLTVLTEASDTNLSASENARIEQEVVSANEQMNKAAESLDVGKFFDWILDSLFRRSLLIVFMAGAFSF
ncbi:MAG: hypothetical protein P8Y94_14345 [Acidobacteriota bacterium]